VTWQPIRFGRANLGNRAYAHDGFVYFVQRPSDGAVKIGFTTNLYGRLDALASSVKEPLRTLGVIRSTMRLERELHEWFADTRRSTRRSLGREWFDPSEDLLWFVSQFATAPLLRSS